MSQIPLLSITLLAVDTGNDLQETEFAIEQCKKHFTFADVKLLTKKELPHVNSYQTYNEFMIRELHKWFNTDFVLTVQQDGFIVNPNAWTDDFLQYDYVGSPWDKIRLGGNGGFSLRSKKLCQATSKSNGYIRGEDTFICVEHGRELIQQGIKFAPYEVGCKFSWEYSQDRRQYTGSFGYHGNHSLASLHTKGNGPTTCAACYIQTLHTSTTLKNRNLSLPFKIEKMKQKQILALACDSGSCGQYRIIQPFKHFDYPEVHVEPLLNQNVMIRYEFYDAVIIQRPIAGCIDWINHLMNSGKKVFIEVDDMYPLEDPENPTYELYKPGSDAANHILECIRISNGVMTNTPALVEHYSQYNKNVGFFPNAVDFNNPIYKKPRQRPTDKTIMFWSGSSGHGSNLSIIKDAVSASLKKFPDLVLVMCSTPHNPDLLNMFEGNPDQKIAIPPCSFEEYGNLHSIADFVLAPIKDNSYNRAKSNIRILEPAVWSIPSIASPVGEYNNFDEHIPIATTSEDWEHCIEMMMDRKKRKEIGIYAHDAAFRKYDLKVWNDRRALWFEQSL